MSMKCRCGSDDKLEFSDGKIIRKKDGKEHFCEYRQKINTSNIFGDKLKDIDEQVTKLGELEKIVVSNLTVNDVAPDHSKVGMYMKLIYNKML